MLERPPIVLAIGGIDPSGGAGLAMDARAGAGAGVFLRPVASALTVQDSRGVRSVEPVDPDAIRTAIAAALAEGVDVAKTGLLVDEASIRVITDVLPQGMPLVVDPVLRATSGESLADPRALAAYVRLVARAVLVTPNLEEAQRLSGLMRAEEAAWALRKAGARSVLVTGGDVPGPTLTDLFLSEEGELTKIEGKRIEVGQCRGTGCALATLAAAHLAQGYATSDAVQAAIAETRQGIRHAFPQRGATAIPLLSSLLADARAYDVDARSRMARVAAAWRALEPVLTRRDLPEVGSNLSFLPVDGDVARSAGLSARCVRTGTGIRVAGPVEIGGVHHTARIAAGGHEHDARIRSALNLRYHPDGIDRARAAGLVVATFRRADQPDSESSTVAWGTRVAVAAAGRVPDVIYDLGGPGKEPMTRVLGLDPPDVIKKVLILLGSTLDVDDRGPIGAPIAPRSEAS